MPFYLRVRVPRLALAGLRMNLHASYPHFIFFWIELVFPGAENNVRPFYVRPVLFCIDYDLLNVLLVFEIQGPALWEVADVDSVSSVCPPIQKLNFPFISYRVELYVIGYFLPLLHHVPPPPHSGPIDNQMASHPLICFHNRPHWFTCFLVGGGYDSLCGRL